MAKLSTDELLDAFKDMTLLELSEFVKKFEETFEVTAAAPVAVAAAGAAGAPAAAGAGPPGPAAGKRTSRCGRPCGWRPCSRPGATGWYSPAAATPS